MRWNLQLNVQTPRHRRHTGLQFARLFAKFPRPGDYKVICAVFEQAASTCYYQSNHWNTAFSCPFSVLKRY